jgi:putative flippase GtrA
VAVVKARARTLDPDARAQGLRYIAVGCLVGGLYLAITVGLSELAGLPFQVAMPIGYFTAIGVHFALHRSWTFTSDSGYALSLKGQAGRYLAFVVGQYAVVAGAVAVGTTVLDVSPLVAWLAVVAPLTLASFVVLRTKTFHPHTEP